MNSQIYCHVLRVWSLVEGWHFDEDTYEFACEAWQEILEWYRERQ